MKKKFTKKQNELRKDVFNFIRNRADWSASSIKTECRKNFGRSKAVLAAIEECNKRIADSVNLTEKQIFINNVKARINGAAQSLPWSGYSMGEYRHITCRALGGYVDSYDACEYYARSCKYSARHGHVEVELPVRIIAKAENIAGMMIIRTKQIQKRIWKAQKVVFDYTRNGRYIINSDIKWHLEKCYILHYNDSSSRMNGWQVRTNLSDARQTLGWRLREEKAAKKMRKTQNMNNTY